MIDLNQCKACRFTVSDRYEKHSQLPLTADMQHREITAMPTDWANKVTAAITNLDKKTDRVLNSTRSLAIIDDVVEGKLAVGELATIHGMPQEWIGTTLGHVTRMVQGTGRVRSLADGGWYELKNDEQPYGVAPGFAAAWKKARGLS
jgi:hypothetical protein